MNFKKIVILFISLTIIALSFCGCENGSNTEKENTIEIEDTEYYSKFKDADISLNVYNWGEYIPTGEDGSIDLNAEFEELTGIKVNYSTFATNEELYAKLKAGAANYDIIIPSDYMISRMISENMLEKLDFNNIPNFKNIKEQFKNPEFDPTNEYSVPYTWGTVGIIYDKTRVDIPKDKIGWDILWNDEYKDEILMFDNPRDAFAIAEISLGYSINTEDENELKASAEKLKAQKSVVQAYVMDEIFDKMTAGEAVLAPYYAGDAITMINDNENLDFVRPLSNTNLFIDSICIPKGALQKEAAEMYINFMCEASIAAEVANYIGYSTPNEPGFDLLDDDVKENEISYPDDDYLNNYTSVFKNLSPAANQLMQDLWTEMKSEK